MPARDFERQRSDKRRPREEEVERGSDTARGKLQQQEEHEPLQSHFSLGTVLMAIRGANAVWAGVARPFLESVLAQPLSIIGCQGDTGGLQQLFFMILT